MLLRGRLLVDTCPSCKSAAEYCNNVLLALLELELSCAKINTPLHAERTLENASTIILNRPKALNVINLDVVPKIYKHLKKCEKTKSLMIIKGTGVLAFCTGGDPIQRIIFLDVRLVRFKCDVMFLAIRAQYQPRHKNIELPDIVYKEASGGHDQDASGGRSNVFTIKDSATLVHWNNTPTDITYESDGFEGGFGPSHFARMPGFFQPLPHIAYETSVDILIIKARPSSPHLSLH
uniref:3-hydroxyisobutyryl-CoA hydrolase n=1 Tax=Glossina palpalis gambiensis TaxID=67801 RepID=A0A1B0BP63_9MUSC